MTGIKLLIFLLFISQGAAAQPKPLFTLQDCRLINKINSTYRQRQYDSTIYYIRIAQSSNTSIKYYRPLYITAFKAYSWRNRDSALYFLEKAIEYGLHCTTPPCHLSAEYLIFDSLTNQQLSNAFQKKNEKNTLDTQLIGRINEMIDADQAGRKSYPIKIPDSDRLLAQLADSQNAEPLKQIIFSYGWPGYSRVGYEADVSLWTLVQHADNDVTFQKLVLELLEGQILINNTRPENYAYLYDRICVNQNLPQLFGTQIKSISPDGMVLHSLLDAEHVNEYRAAFSLLPISEYLNAIEAQQSGK